MKAFIPLYETMKKTLFLLICGLASCSGITMAQVSPVVETYTLSSDAIASETFTETAAGNGMFYSDKNKVAFIAAGDAGNPYYISASDDTKPDDADISLSHSSASTVTVGSFIGDAHLVIGTADNPIRVYTENSLFVGGYGWHNTNDWKTNATLSSNIGGDVPFAAHEGHITINKGSTLDTGTGTTALGGAQIYIGHGGKGSITVDGGTLTTRAFLGISCSTSTPDDNSGLLEIKNGGKVYIKACPDEINTSYNQIIVGGSNTGKGSIVVSGENSELIMESTNTPPAPSTGASTHTSYISIGKSQQGNGEITVTDGASMTLGSKDGGTCYICIAEGPGSTGSLNISESASASLNADVYIGYQGTGSINIDSGSEVTQTGGRVFVGLFSNGAGELNINGGSSFTADGMSIGYGSATGSVTVAESASMNIGEHIIINDTVVDGVSNNITNNGSIQVGGFIQLDGSSKLTNNGSLALEGDIYVNAGATLENTEDSVIETEGNIKLAIFSTATNNGTMKANEINVALGATLTNTGTILAEGSEKGLYVAEGAILNNEGTLTGKVSGSGLIQGSGKLGDVSISTGTSYMVGNGSAPIIGLQAETLTLEEGSTTMFNVAGFIATAEGEICEWDSGKHSVIYGDVITLAEGARIDITFDVSLFEEDSLSFDFKLIDGGEESNYGNILTLPNYTSFNLSENEIATYAVQGEELAIRVEGVRYYQADNDLYIKGTATIYTIPEPATATLSLLALAGLVGRRRRA